MKKCKIFLYILIALLGCMPLWAGDFGLVLDQSLELNNAGLDYTGILIPRFSALLGENGGFYISAGAKFQNNPWTIVPELLRTEFNWGSGSKEFKIGRVHYSDPLGYIANGLFDGAGFSMDTQAGTFSAAAFYTGLLYKKRANITMTDGELKSASSDLVYTDFLKTYFAPKRIVAALGWEHPGLRDLVYVNLALLGQYDFSAADLHSQYLAAKISIPYNDFIFDLGGSLELIEDSGKFGIGLAGELGAVWMLPTRIEDRLSFLGRFSSGTMDNSRIKAFLPITTNPQGYLLQPKLSGISMISIDYLGRFHKTFSALLSSSYFIRSDLNSHTLIGNNGWFLGNEFYGQVMWSPVSDIQVNLGGGVFLPSLGNAAPKADLQWRVELNVILSLY